jgi:hypothetical protein
VAAAGEALPLDAQLVPLTELDSPYLGVGEQGLYPGGANTPTGAWLAEALALAGEVVPRDASGAPDAAGWIGFVSVGISNTNQEWSRFERESDRTGAHAARVVLVDAAQGGQDVFAMDDAGDPYWILFDERLAAAGVDPDQVQVVWLKQSVAGEQLVGDFPERMEPLRSALGRVVDLLAARCPNLELVLLSSRIWSSSAGRRTFAYETAFAAKGLIEDRMALPSGTSPWVGWGPYLWADGTTPRADRLTWELWDLESDGVHPSLTAEWTVAQALEAFLATSDWTAPWYRPTGAAAIAAIVALDAEADAHVDPADPEGTFGLEPLLRLDGGRRVYLRFDLSEVSAPLLRAKLSLLADPESGPPPIDVSAVAPLPWEEATISWSSAPSPLAPALGQPPGWSRGGAWAFDATAAVAVALSSGGGSITFALETPQPVAGPRSLLARESGEPPRLILTLDEPGGQNPIFVDRFETGDTWPWH